MIDLSAAELLALDSQVQFQGERILHAPSVNFLDHNWDTILGTVDNQIYKVALQISGLIERLRRIEHCVLSRVSMNRVSTNRTRAAPARLTSMPRRLRAVGRYALAPLCGLRRRSAL